MSSFTSAEDSLHAAYVSAMEKIKKATGIRSVKEIVSKFLGAEQAMVEQTKVVHMLDEEVAHGGAAAARRWQRAERLH